MYSSKNKTKRLQTLKKKARELSILCDIDVCFVGTSRNNDPESSDSGSRAWTLYPEDPQHLARIVKKYKDRVEEQPKIEEPEIEEENMPLELDKRENILEFDVDKALEGLDLEELSLVLDRAKVIAGKVDEKLDLFSRNGNSMSVQEGISEESAGASKTTIITSRFVAIKGPKVFGVYLTPVVELQSDDIIGAPAYGA